MATMSTNYWKGVIETIDLISGLSAKFFQGLIQGKELPELLEEIEAKASLKITSGTNTLVSELGLESVVGRTETQKFDQDYWRAVKDTTAYTRNWILKNGPDESVLARFLYQIRKKAVQKLGEEVNPLEKELGDLSLSGRSIVETKPAASQPSASEGMKVNLPPTTVRRSIQELTASESAEQTTPTPSTSTPPPTAEEQPPMRPPSIPSMPVETPTPPPSSTQPSEATSLPQLDELESIEIPPTPPPMSPATTAPRPATTAPSPSLPSTTPVSSPDRPTTTAPRPPATPGIPDLSLLMSEEFEDLSQAPPDEKVPQSIQELQKFEMEEKPVSPSEPTLRDALLGTAKKGRPAPAAVSDEDEDELSASLKSALKLLRDEED